MDMRDTIVRGGGGDSAIKVVDDSTIEYLFKDVVFEAFDGRFVDVSGMVATLVDGQEYIVTINDVDYTTTGQTVDAGGLSFVVLGNAYLFDVGEDTGEPFFMVSIPDNGTAIVIPDLADETSITVSARTRSYSEHLELEQGVHTFNIPSVYKRPVMDEHLFYDKDTVERDYGLYTFNAEYKRIEAGKEYEIVLNGTSYIRTAVEYDNGNDYYLGVAIRINDEENNEGLILFTNSKMGHAFSIVIGDVFGMEWWQNDWAEGSGFTIGINEVGIIPLDPKYIQLTSPNGTKYSLSVSDDGALSAVPIE